MIYNVKSQFDKMCSLLRGSFVLESSSCTYIQSFGWKICWLGFGSIHVILIHPKFIHCWVGFFFLHVNIVMWVNENFMCNIKLLLIFVKVKVMYGRILMHFVDAFFFENHVYLKLIPKITLGNKIISLHWNVRIFGF